MTRKEVKDQTIRFCPQAAKIVEVNLGHNSVNETVNRLIIRAASMETEDTVMYRIKSLVERNLAILNTVYENTLQGDIEIKRQQWLSNIRNEAND